MVILAFLAVPERNVLRAAYNGTVLSNPILQVSWTLSLERQPVQLTDPKRAQVTVSGPPEP